MTDPFSAGQILTAADLNKMPRPVAGDWLSADGSATSAGTELLVCTTPSFTPVANMIYHVKYRFRYGANTNAAGDIFFLRIRSTNISGTIRAAARLDPPGSSTSPLQHHGADYIFDSGSSPASMNFVGTVYRDSGDGTITPLSFTSLIVYLVGTPTNFT